MTRISGYDLYACPVCSQVHRKSTHSSISVTIPSDLFTKDSDIKTCQGCGVKKSFSEFVHMGHVDREPPIFYEPKKGFWNAVKILFISEKIPVRPEPEYMSYPYLMD